MEHLMNLLREGVTAAHTIDFVKRELLDKQFQELRLEDKWELQESGKYYVNLYGTNCIAFSVGEKMDAMPSFRIAMAHSDYPKFQIKPAPCMEAKHCTKLNVEIYGGMYQKSWLDRPLGVAGQIIKKGKNVFEPEMVLYNSDAPLCMIPSLAIHMDRELNKKGALDTAKELVPITALMPDADLLAYIADSLQMQVEDILDYDLYLYNIDAPCVVGLDASMIASPRLDNLSSVGAILEAIAQTKVAKNAVDVMVVFDHEEVGSLSKQGADSELLPMVIEKIGKSFVDDFSIVDTVERSFLLSVDVAHAHHPNYEEKSDATNKAYLGQGLCIKKSVGQKYGTTAMTAAVLRQLCEANGISYNIAINKTGILGGSTLGPIVCSHLPMPCVDIGMPILAMHSALELGAVKDYEALKQLMKVFYQIENV